ncbi:hypothiocyanous acid reductase MerA [Staphylococcus canis]|uniref:FAD-containing oxidoreductase n=1 Tax=Staphylococcus canis TaxID=2724942 RepID=A0ABS0TAG2_9STAP|nr:hypothiocyanous acid reductase MerA [Staphylococcus canis]MBI5975728.1 FAD-containing oxidoreductase [Staphylococcus canis]
MKQYDIVIIGFGKGGKTLAKVAAQQGKRVAVIEKSQKMYGGTCINIGCIPSKTLVHDADRDQSFTDAMARKQTVVSQLNDKNYHNLADESTVDVLDYKAQFKNNQEVALVDASNQEVDTVTAPHIIINTGATPVIPKIEGIDTASRVYDSTGIMELSEQPEHLVIVGGGYIALEFASMFAEFGTKVTVLERSERILAREDQDIAREIQADLEAKGIQFVFEAETQSVKDQDHTTAVETTQGTFEADAVLLATGRKPNTDLALENTDIELGDRGEIKVNAQLQTSVPHIYAIGDVKGGMQFTYISLDDFRIIKSQLFGDGQRTTDNRGHVPYTVFITPSLARVGLTAADAQSKGYDIVENQVPVKTMPRHKINNDTRGLFKVVINKKDGTILGASLYGAQVEELINIVKLAMDQNLSYTVLRDQIYTHPTMAESFNDLFNVSL